MHELPFQDSYSAYLAPRCDLGFRDMRCHIHIVAIGSMKLYYFRVHHHSDFFKTEATFISLTTAQVQPGGSDERAIGTLISSTHQTP